MANLTPVNSFDDVIQLETTDVAIGGAGGIMNAQAQALLNRTAHLKGVYDALNAMIGAVSGNGIAPLFNGLIPSSFLPSYVDDVLEYANLAAFPVTGESSKIYIDMAENLIYRWSGSTYFAVGGTGGGLGIREDVTFSATALSNNATVTNTVSIASRYQLLHITTSHPCRVRLYTSTAKRDADLIRSIGTDPTGNHGLLFEFISTTALLSADLSPLVDGFADTAAIPYSLTNLSGAPQTISVTLNHVKTGA